MRKTAFFLRSKRYHFTFTEGENGELVLNTEGIVVSEKRDIFSLSERGNLYQ